jgi:transcriptional regulator with XRE-family HTH domain
MKTLGKNIRLLRHQKGWSQEDVAKKLDISIPAFSKIETGITDINLTRLEQIANMFELSVTALISFNSGEDEIKHDMLQAINKKLLDREFELINLQKKVIELYEELRKVNANV